MPLDFVVNDLSYASLAADIHDARARMLQLVHTLRRLARLAAGSSWLPQLRMEHAFLSTDLSVGYNIARWRNDAQVDLELRRVFAGLAQRAPYLDGVSERELEGFPPLYEYRFRGEIANGLGVAHLLRAIAVSLPSDRCWDSPRVIVEAHHLDEDSELESSVEVHHASSPEHAEAVREFVVRRLGEESNPLTTFAELWRRRREVFPGLQFCVGVERQLERLDVRAHLRPVIVCLQAINDYVARWQLTEREFSHHEMAGVSPESESRRKALGHQITFQCPDGSTRLFSLHARYTPGAGRIHFLPDIEARRIVIGYVGPKVGI
jgi:hypothetical protein